MDKHTCRHIDKGTYMIFSMYSFCMEVQYMLNFIQDVQASDKLSGNYILFLLIIFYPFVNVIFLVSKYLYLAKSGLQ